MQCIYLMLNSFRFCVFVCVCVSACYMDVGDTLAEHPTTLRTDAPREHFDVEETALGHEWP